MENPNENDKILFIYADDDADDHFFLNEACQEINANFDMHSVFDGEALVKVLSVPPPLRPNFILVDINMPRMDGLSAIHIIRDDLGLKDFPIFILSTNKGANALKLAEQYDVQGVFKKPQELGELQKIVVEVFALTSNYHHQHN